MSLKEELKNINEKTPTKYLKSLLQRTQAEQRRLPDTYCCDECSDIDKLEQDQRFMDSKESILRKMLKGRENLPNAKERKLKRQTRSKLKKRKGR